MNQHAKRRAASKRQAGHHPAGPFDAPEAIGSRPVRDDEPELVRPPRKRAEPAPPPSGLEGPLVFTVDPDDVGHRLDRYLSQRVELAAAAISRTRVQSLVESGRVSVDAHIVASTSAKVLAGQIVVIDVPPPEAAEPAGENIALVVVFEDDHLLVIDKPAGLVVHPGAGHATGTLVNALIHHCGESLSGIGGVKRPGIVHRLDKDTSGLLVVAKTDVAHAGLSLLFADHGRTLSLTRRYQAFLWGAMDRTAGLVDLPVGRHAIHREKMAVVPLARGREAITHWHMDEGFGRDRHGKAQVSRVTCTLETGRTHQIRVHMAHVGHPVMCDPVYGAGFRTKAAALEPPAQAAFEALHRQALHAAVLGFEHPATGEELMFESPLPPDMQALLEGLQTG